MRQIVVNVSDELFNLIGGDVSQVSNFMIQAVVAQLVRRKVISSDQASKVLGIDRQDVPVLLSQFGIYATELPPSPEPL